MLCVADTLGGVACLWNRGTGHSSVVEMAVAGQGATCQAGHATCAGLFSPVCMRNRLPLMCCASLIRLVVSRASRTAGLATAVAHWQCADSRACGNVQWSIKSACVAVWSGIHGDQHTADVLCAAAPVDGAS